MTGLRSEQPVEAPGGGVVEMSDAGEKGTAAATPTAPRRARGLLPGLALVVAGTAVAKGVNLLVPQLSTLLVAILLGALVANVVRVPEAYAPGIRFAAKPVLRVGIALLGLQLLLSDILGLGWQVVALVVVIVAGGILGTMWVGGLMGVSRPQRLLIACGFSICGAAAVAGAQDSADADEEDVLTAVALVVLFGTLMIGLVPLVVSWTGMSDLAAGMWAGGAVHEVAQVVAVGGIIGGSALAVATVVKLTRVLMLAPVIAVLNILQRRERGTDAERTGARPPIVPLFIIGFLALVALRSTGVVPDGALAVAGTVQTLLLAAAMFALGLGVRFSSLREVGPRPLALGAVSTLWVLALALGGVFLIVPDVLG